MGTGLLEFYNNRIKKEWKIAFYSAFVVCILTHIYKFTNTLPNHDALYNTYSSQNMINLGRWLLAPACCLSTLFDLPWITGLIATIFLGICVVILVELFEVKNPVVIVLIAGLMVTFPAITETFFFEYTSDGYMIAMLLASIAVLCSMKSSGKDTIIASVCICCACGIYQAYVAYAAVLVLCYMIYSLLTRVEDDKSLYRFIGRQIIIFGVGLGMYIIVWRVLCKLEGVVVSGYEGINNVGKVSLGTVVGAIKNTIKEFVQFFIKWDVRKYGFNVWIVLSILFIATFVFVLLVAIKASEVYKRKIQLVILVVAIAFIPFAIFMWFFTSDGVVYNVRMEQSVCLLYVLTVVICDRFLKPVKANIVAILMAVIIFNNLLIANMYYYYMNRAYEKGYSIAQEVLTRIHLVDDGSAKRIAIIGQLDGFEYEDYKKSSVLGDLGPLYVVDYSLGGNAITLPLFMSNYLDFSMDYYRNNDEDMPIYVPLDSTAPISFGWYIKLPYVDERTYGELEASEIVGAMKNWPARDSIKIIDDTIVIKFSDPVMSGE